MKTREKILTNQRQPFTERREASRSREIRIRRSRSLIAYWENKEFLIENYLTGKQTTISPMVADLLNKIDNYETRQTVLKIFCKIPRVAELIDLLISRSVLVVESSILDRKERLMEKTWKWKIDARYFHYSTRKTMFKTNLEEENKNLIWLAKKVPPPSPFKDYESGTSIRLADSMKDNSKTMKNDGSFWRALYERRTRRSFARKDISFRDFSTIMLWTWGKTRTITDPQVGEYILKTSPSGGARHPIEVYPVVIRVQGIPPGLYHYSVRHHGLELIRPGNFEVLAVDLCAGQKWIRNSSVAFFMTAKLDRSMWKYSQSHAYRVILLDAGHVGQTFHLVCTKLRLAPFTTAANNDPMIEDFIGIDGVTEIPLYTAAAGIPSNRE